jgi:hypothetical protein
VETDYYFRMGKTHTVCQDYAAAGSHEGKPYALLSDGCSGIPNKDDPGSPHTDWGARFLVRAAQRHLPDLFERMTMPTEVIAYEALNMAYQTRLSRLALDATLLAVVNNGRYTRTYQTGDGVVAARYRDGRLEYNDIEFGNNMPYYLAYELDRDRERQMLDTAKTATRSWRVFEPGKGWGEKVSVVHDLNDQFRMVQTHIFDVDEIEYVLILSDGAKSFMQKGSAEAIPLETVIEHVLSLKNGKGEFLQRRLRAFELHCAREGWAHNDDFSCAGIYHGPSANDGLT